VRTKKPSKADRFQGLPGAPPKYKRLPRDRRDGLPLAVKMRIIDAAARQHIRDIGRCEWPGCREFHLVLHCAHVRGVGAGGDDVEGNMVCLCAFHHNEHHAKRITDDQLRVLIARRPCPTSSP
jgi:hypothetical protein